MKRRILKNPLQWLIPLLLILFLVFPVAAATGKKSKTAKNPQVIAFGDKCTVEYSCRLKNGSLLLTTMKDVAEDSKVAKSDLFLALQEYKPVELMAGIDAAVSMPQYANLLMTRMHRKLAEDLDGMEVGKSFNVKLTTEDMPMPDGSSTEVRMKIMRVRPIVREMTTEFFKRHSNGRDPKVGMEIQTEPPGNKWGEPGGIWGRVTKIEGDTVFVKAMLKPGDDFMTPFGPATVERFRDDNFMEIRMRPHIGKVMRFGHMLGRISRIEEDVFIIDTGNPFGGETLYCDALVLNADSDSPEKRAFTEKMFAEMERVFQTEKHMAVTPAKDEKPDVVQSGDMVWVQYKLTDDKGVIRFSNFSEDVNTKDKKSEVAGDLKLRSMLPYFPVVAANEGEVPGLDIAVLGMKVGEQKKMTLPPAKAYGERDESLVVRYDRIQEIGVKTTMERDRFEMQFKATPKEGGRQEIAPFGTALINKVTDQEVAFTIEPDERRIDRPMGTMEIKRDGNVIRSILTPRVGAPFSYDGKDGVIVKSDDKYFTADFNHPMAGRTLSLEVAVRNIQKASKLTGNTIAWQEDYDKALAKAKSTDKPVALVLYADWCGWCKRLFSETLTDPVITAMADQYVWARVNSDKQQEYKRKFQQESFPMMVLLDKKERVIKKLKGFQGVYPLWENLESARVQQ